MYLNILGKYLYSIILLLCLESVKANKPESLTLEVMEITTKEDALAHLQQYGYVGKWCPVRKIAKLFEKDPEQAYVLGLKMMQAFNGLEITGELDIATQQLMAMPRCGCMDLEMMDDVYALVHQVQELEELVSVNKRTKRFSVVGNSIWNPGDVLSYAFRNFTFSSTLNPSKILEEAEACFNMWSSASNIFFQLQDTPPIAQLDTFFVSGIHNDGSSFDGPSGVLAHAFLPTSSNFLSGDIHLDAAESWSSETFSGINFLQVFCHEVGHAIGLRHSDVRDALMYAFYRGYDPDFALHPDDIAGAQALYGQPIEPPETPDFCSETDLGIDAMAYHSEGGTFYYYAFKGDFYARIDSAGIASGFPRRISDDWVGITGGVDAALFLPAYRGRPAFTLLFTGNRYYIYEEDRTLVGSTDGSSLTTFRLPSDLSGIDAAYRRTLNGRMRIFFTKDDEYYKLSRRRRYPVSRLLRVGRNYPRSLSFLTNNIPNGPTSFDAAANVEDSIGSEVFLFKDDTFYKYDHADRLVSASGSIRDDWFGCSG